MPRTTWIFLQLDSLRGSRRPVLFFVVVLIHVVLITTLADSARTRASRKRSDAVDPIRLVFIDSTTSSASSPTESASPPLPLSPTDIARSLATPSIPEINTPPEPSSDTPSPDWSGEITAAARDAIARQLQRDALPRIGAHPKGMKPPRRKTHTPGETQDVGEGEILTWVNDYCFFSNRVTRSNGIGGIKPLCVDVPPPYQSLEDWTKSRRKLADERDEE